VVAAHHSEVAGGVGKLALLYVLDPSAEHANRDLMFFLTSDSAGVATDTAVLINDKSVSHRLKIRLSPVLLHETFQLRHDS
jgi:hypothetical protein